MPQPKDRDIDMKKITYICDYCRFSTSESDVILEIEIEIGKKGKVTADICSENCAKGWTIDKIGEIFKGG